MLGTRYIQKVYHEGMKEQKMGRIIVGVLHDIRSQYNVGSMFRTADAAGVSHMYLLGYTPTPTDRFGRKVKEIAKTALGAEESIPWTASKDSVACILALREEGYQIIACETGTKNGKNHKDIQFQKKVALIMGNEIEGIPKNILSSADAVLEIPQFGSKESLNVSVAFGVATYGIRQAS